MRDIHKIDQNRLMVKRELIQIEFLVVIDIIDRNLITDTLAAEIVTIN